MNHRRYRTRSVLALTLGAIASVSLIGCGAYRLNPTPGSAILGGSNDQAWNRAAITQDTNLRAMTNDWASFWLLDRPSRLHKEPSPY
jgi:hypothetical protein